LSLPHRVLALQWGGPQHEAMERQGRYHLTANATSVTLFENGCKNDKTKALSVNRED
jgi:hypothetical protein